MGDRPLQRLEVLGIEPLPDVAGERVEVLAIHALHHPAPAFDDDRRHR